MNNTLSKDKDDILGPSWFYAKRSNGAEVLVVSYESAKLSMDEWAIQESRIEAIEFRKWVNWNIDTATSYLTTEEMYDLYLLHKQNKEQ